MPPIFEPPFCPHEDCAWHAGFASATNFKKQGHLRNASGLSRQRFQCKGCQRGFSENTFHFNYRFKKKDAGLSAKILKTFILGASNRGIGRHLNISEHCVRIRLKRMAQWGLLHHAERLNRVHHYPEPLCYDGLENFSGSQYDPNNINQVIGRDTLFVYDFNFAPLNRKGKASDRQKLKKRGIETAQGRYPRDGIRKATTEIFTRLLRKANRTNKLRLLTDQHFQYRRSLLRDLKDQHFEHQTVSSKATRNFQNILFPVNHADLMIRQQVAAFSRETIAFAKTPARMCQKYVLFMIYKNYMCPQFTKAHVRRPRAHLESPAQALGLERKILNFHEFFSELRTFAQVKAPPEWRLFANDQVPYTRMKQS